MCGPTAGREMIRHSHTLHAARCSACVAALLFLGVSSALGQDEELPQQAELNVIHSRVCAGSLVTVLFVAAAGNRTASGGSVTMYNAGACIPSVCLLCLSVLLREPGLLLNHLNMFGRSSRRTFGRTHSAHQPK